ncbi:MAG: hypothetical protein NUW01_01345 [Gemmatimonadaceae bacterium]|nr:hypothetical protein [Gemmatimonadaceae bacterium]
MQIAPSTKESTKPLLRPDAAAELKRDIQAAESKLESKHIEDKNAVRKQLIKLRETYSTQIPKPFANGEDEGAAVRRADELLASIREGMLSAEEMRACPPGAPDRHLAWERKNKMAILEWKNLMLRLRPGEREAANLERYRPKANSMNLDNAYVQRKQFFGLENVTGPTVTFSDDELVALQALDPATHAMIGTLDNEARSAVKRLISGIVGNMAKAETKGKKQ